MDATEKLSRALGRPDTVLFIGSGVSCSAGLPNWHGLLVSFSVFCASLGKDVAAANELIDQNNLDEAASCLSVQLESGELEQFFAQEESFQNAEPQALHDRIMAFGLTCFITTNYDTLIEESFALANPGENLEVVTNNDIDLLARIQSNSTQNFVYKYHGDINDIKSIILTSLGYAKVMHTQPIVGDTLSGLLKSRSVVMIGVGLQDPDLDYILTRLNEIYGGTIEDTFSINSNVDDVRRQVIKETKGIDVISYPASGNDHSGLEELLGKVYRMVSDAKEESEPKTESDVESGQPTVEFTPEEISDRIDRIAPEDAELRRKILSASHWIGPIDPARLFEAVTKLKPDANTGPFEHNLDWLVHEGILRVSSDIVFPEDKDLVGAVAERHMGDAEILLAGVENG